MNHFAPQPDLGYLVLYEAKAGHHFDHRFGDCRDKRINLEICDAFRRAVDSGHPYPRRALETLR
jgi:hypothetical protein